MTQRCSASSIPRPSRSNFTRPIAAQSSLSHCRTVRPGMRPHSTGQTSITGRSHSTMPAEWMPRCRGRLSIWVAMVVTSSGTSGLRGHGVAIDAVAQHVGLFFVVAEGARHVAQRRARPVRDDRGHLGRVAPVVALVDVLDHLFAPTGLDVDVDVRGAVARRGQEALEEQVQLHRVGVRDAQRETDRRVRGRAAALAVDVVDGDRTR